MQSLAIAFAANVLTIVYRNTETNEKQDVEHANARANKNSLFTFVFKWGKTSFTILVHHCQYLLFGTYHEK